mmetsp:Transcript_21682/g.60287  ORF Transcript_21682/g.60287 Transcript_21682/m.60287 type:complete len:817 (+) Transcript_21682:143-2593(+)
MGLCCCCYGDAERPPPPYGNGPPPEQRITPYSDRKPRDVFCLVMYTLFWIGLLLIAGVCFLLGDPLRIVYGLDGYGNTCGALADWNGTGGPDLTARRKLYYLSPFDALNPASLLYGHSICVETCPTSVAPCTVADPQCLDTGAFRCPYYRTAEDSLYGTLDGVDDWSTQYWNKLNTTNISQCPGGQASKQMEILERLLGMQASDALDDLFPSTTCGEQLQKSSLLAQGPCYPVIVNTTDVLNRCFPNFDSDVLAAVAGASSGAIWDAVQSVWDATRLERFFVDVLRSWTVILAVGIGAAVFFAVIWLILLRFLGGVMVGLTVLLVNLALIGCALCSFSLAGMLGTAGEAGQWLESRLPEELSPADRDQKVWEWMAYITCVLEVVVFIICIVLITKIRVAVSIIKVAIEAIGTVPSLMIFPFLPLLCEAALVVAWMAVAAFMWSCGEVVPVLGGQPVKLPSSSALADSLLQATGFNFSQGSSLGGMDPEYMELRVTAAACANDPDCHYELRWPTPFWFMAFYHLFGLFWVTQFIAGFTTVVVSGAVANFYWNRGTRGGVRNDVSPLGWALRTAFCCHMGSVALGSFITALVAFVRVILEYIHRKTKSATEGTICGSVMSMLRCCCWCFQKFLDFVNRNTLIMVGVKGKGYCASAARSSVLLLSNVVRVAVVNTVSGFLMWLGKLLVMALCGMLAFLICELPFFNDPVNFPDTYVTSSIVPVIATIVTAYLIADVYFQVYDVVVDTILLAFCEDCELHNGHPRFAPHLLMKAVGGHPDGRKSASNYDSLAVTTAAGPINSGAVQPFRSISSPAARSRA